MQMGDKSTIFMKEQFKKYYDKSAGSLSSIDVPSVPTPGEATPETQG